MRNEHRRRGGGRVVVSAVGLSLVATFSACTSGEQAGPPPAPATTPGSQAGSGGSEGAGGSTGEVDPEQVIQVRIAGGETEPNGERVEVRGDEPVVFDVTADEAGELGVHTDTEQNLPYDVGRTRVVLEPLDRPGIYEVENHELDVTIVQLAVTG